MLSPGGGGGINSKSADISSTLNMKQEEEITLQILRYSI
jgi:hypothetical protein